MKLLIINPQEYEFNNYWKMENNTNGFALIRPNNSNNILFIIKRKALKYNEEEIDIGDVNYGKILEKILDEQLTTVHISKDSIHEMGIISHADSEANISSSSNEFKSKNKGIFNNTYGSKNKPRPGLCQSDFNAINCQGTFPLDKLRDAVCNCKNSNFDEAFEEVWNFFLGDPVLEAKLELLHACLTPEGAKNIVDSGFPQNLEKEKKLVELNPSLFSEENSNRDGYAVYKDWTVEEIVKALSGDISTDKKIQFTHNFNTNYLTALSILRDCLLY